LKLTADVLLAGSVTTESPAALAGANGCEEVSRGALCLVSGAIQGPFLWFTVDSLKKLLGNSTPVIESADNGAEL